MPMDESRLIEFVVDANMEPLPDFGDETRRATGCRMPSTDAAFPFTSMLRR
jgi:hypothetical protein